MALRALVVLALARNIAIAWNYDSHRLRCRKHCNPTTNQKRNLSFSGDCHRSTFQTRSFLTNDGTSDPQSRSDQRLQRLSTPTKDVTTLLYRMIVHFESMVDPRTNRFFLLSYPRAPSEPFVQENPKELRSHVRCPLRDLGSAWDAAKSLRVLRVLHSVDDETRGMAATAAIDGSTGRNLRDAILQTTKHYSSSLVSLEGHDHALFMSPETLEEPPNIAHNALLILALVESKNLGLFDTELDGKVNWDSVVDGLARGILCLQRADGAFRTEFLQTDSSGVSEDVSRGIEFLPGEAMTALMELHRYSRGFSRGLDNCLQDEILQTMLSALEFYSDYYNEGRKQNAIDANYSIWQIQAFARLVVAMRQQQPQSESIAKASKYCLELCKDILQSPAWKLLSRGKSFYPNLSTVEIACGLDALSWGVVALDNQAGNEDNERLLFLLSRNIDEAVSFLEWSQDRVPADSLVGYGGLGHGGYVVTEQRLDVTGHALSAIVNLVVPR